MAQTQTTLVILIPGLYGTSYTEMGTKIFPPSVYNFVRSEFPARNQRKLTSSSLCLKVPSRIYAIPVYNRIKKRLAFHNFVKWEESQKGDPVNESLGKDPVWHAETSDAIVNMMVPNDVSFPPHTAPTIPTAVYPAFTGTRPRDRLCYTTFGYNWLCPPTNVAHDLLTRVLEIVRSCDFDNIFFVGHSLGGYITRIMFEIELVQFEDDDRGLKTQLSDYLVARTKGVFLVGAPLYGSEQIWNTLSTSPRPRWRQWMGFFSDTQIRAILRNNTQWAVEMMCCLYSKDGENIQRMAQLLQLDTKTAQEIYTGCNKRLVRDNRIIRNNCRRPPYFVFFKQYSCLKIAPPHSPQPKYVWSDGVVTQFTARPENTPTSGLLGRAHDIEPNHTLFTVKTKKHHFRLLEQRQLIDCIFHVIMGGN